MQTAQGPRINRYHKQSFWLESSGDDLESRAPLDGSASVDVAILGAGFTGLWTAWYLLQRDPSLKVAVVEAEIAGYGASGRNGGWCVADFPFPIESMRERHGDDTTRLLYDQMAKSVQEIGRVCEEQGIDAHYVCPGTLDIARAPHHMPAMEARFDTLTQLGLDDRHQLLDADGVAEYLKVRNAVGAISTKHGASVQPARLVRGLARAVERAGATIYEQTRVTDFTQGPNPSLITERGTVNAKVIVLAGEGYLSQLPKTKRAIIPATSHMVVTEPLSDDIWREIGWEHRGVVTGRGYHGGYLNKTADGRIAFGAFRAVYPFGSKITEDLYRQEAIFEHAQKSARDWFPMLKSTRFTHAWGGVFGMPRDRMPTMSYDRSTGIATGRGYTGEGVATSNLSGRVLADLITGTDSELTTLPMTTHQSPDWEPEPLRWIGAAYVRKQLYRTEEEAERTGRYPSKPTLAQRLFAP